MINWNTDKDAHLLIAKIAHRAVRYYADNDIEIDYQTTVMDLTACHANGMPLKLDDLFNADGLNFAHDISGISNYIDRATGKMTRCFVPRYAAA